MARGKKEEVICREYAKVSYTADQIVSDPAISQEFLEIVNENLPTDSKLGIAELNHDLLNLRKLGEKRGGLARKERAFNGRGKKPR